MENASSWKTTLLGILTLIATIAKLAADVLGGHPVDLGTTAVGLTAGAGLIAAKDHDVTGGTR